MPTVTDPIQDDELKAAGGASHDAAASHRQDTGQTGTGAGYTDQHGYQSGGDSVANDDQADAFNKDFVSRGTINEADRNTNGGMSKFFCHRN